MFEGVMQKTRSPWRPLWPDVSYIAGAEEAIRLGYWTAFILAILIAFVSVFGVMGANLWGLLLAVAYALAGLGIGRKWPSAALAALILSTVGIILTFGLRHFWLVIALQPEFFVGALRATLAYPELLRNQAENPSTLKTD